MEQDDEDYLDTFEENNAHDINAILSFFENIRDRVMASESFRLRALAILLKAVLRIRCLFHEFKGVDLKNEAVCDNGFSEMISCDAETRAKRLLTWVCSLWPDSVSLKKSVDDWSLLRSVVQESFSVLESDYESICANSLKGELLNICGFGSGR